MEYNKLITDMTHGDEVEGFYVLKAANPKTTASGKPFLSATLSDKSGAIEIKVWDYTGPIASADEGKVVKIRGNVGEYRGIPQVTVDRIRLADDNDQYDLSALVPVAPIDVGATLGELKDLIDSIEDKDYKEICKMLFAKHYDAWATIPAAKSVHHAFLNGLLMHTVSMMKIADFLAGLYGDIIDRSLLLAGAFLHDFGKQQEFSFSQLGLVTDYSVKGQLLGHLVIGAQEVAQFAARLGTPEDKSILLQHMILSHHGEPEFGAAVKPICAESELLSQIDMIDSRMEIYRETLQDMQVGEVSNRIFALDKRVYRHK